MPNVLSVLIWVQTVCKDYEQTTLVDKVLNDTFHVWIYVLIYYCKLFGMNFGKEMAMRAKQVCVLTTTESWTKTSR